MDDFECPCMWIDLQMSGTYKVSIIRKQVFFKVNKEARATT